MKTKIYYRYNPQTLTYERVYRSAKDKFFTVLRHLLSGIVIGGLLFSGAWYVLGTPYRAAERKEKEITEAQYKLLSKRLDDALSVLEDIQQRDDYMYRAIFHAEPVSSSIRNSGIGNIGRYEHLTNLSASDLIIQTSQKADYLEKQLYVQSNSFDYLIGLSKTQKDRLKHIPSIQPVAEKNLKHVASGYGTRIDPIYGTPRFHAGMDFTARVGTPVYATGQGTVIYADWKQGYGKCIIIDHGYNY